MRFRVGPWVYKVRIYDGPIPSNEGPLAGQADEANREILLASTLQITRRLDVLLHELRHCWLFHFPRPRTTEEDCNFSSAVTASAMMDLDSQGGEVALMRMKVIVMLPDGAPEPRIVYDEGERFVAAGQIDGTEAFVPARAGRAQCGKCETIVADGSIVGSKPRWDYVAFGNVMDRAMYCPHCHHVQRWVEGCTVMGTPNGAVVDGPAYTTGPGVEEFLAKYPVAVGMVC